MATATPVAALANDGAAGASWRNVRSADMVEADGGWIFAGTSAATVYRLQCGTSLHLPREPEARWAPAPRGSELPHMAPVRVLPMFQ
jgi:hypothetical protein